MIARGNHEGANGSPAFRIRALVFCPKGNERALEIFKCVLAYTFGEGRQRRAAVPQHAAELLGIDGSEFRQQSAKLGIAYRGQTAMFEPGYHPRTPAIGTLRHHIVFRKREYMSLFAAAFLAATLSAQAPQGPDVLILNDGEKLLGHFVKATGGSLTFRSDALGALTVDWSKVKELQSSQKVAVIPPNVTLRLPRDAAKVTRGTLSMTDQKLQVSSGQTVPLADVGTVIDDAEFQRALEHKDGLLHGWKGGIAGGAALVEATQNSRTFNAAVNLIQQVPGEDWLAPRYRTTLDFDAVYGKLTQPGTPDVLTSIEHFDAERDFYFNPRWFGFGQAALDHNFAQGLHLQQNYGGGVGWIAMKNANQELDLKVSASYVRQDLVGVPDLNLAGATFGETFNRKLAHGMLISQDLSLVEPVNHPSDYTAAGGLHFVMPVYKRLSLTAGTVDNFLNDPPPGFKKNSFQVTTGVAYTLK